MISAFIDTNIFVRVTTQGRPGCEQRLFEDLRTLVDERAFRLLVPEIVSLEVEKVFRTLPKSIESACDKLSDGVSRATQDTWSEIDSLKSDVLSRINEFKKLKVEECRESSSNIIAFLQSQAVTSISLTPEILVAAKRRHIIGKMPNCKKSSDQDVLIVESLVSFFAECNESDASLLFCTENTSDFALEVRTGELERRFVLDPQIQEALPAARFSTDLATMLGIVNGFEQLPEPSNSAIEYAVSMRDLHDEDDDAFWEFQSIITNAVHKESAKKFEEEMLPSIPDDVRALRYRMSQQAKDLLAACRRCHSWGERSEYKLPQWIEYVDEPMIPFTSLPKLVRIKNSLKEYLEVHQKMDADGIVG
jgi:predicted nucleic acid-binding protein